jgi:hypothetical protein
MSENSECPAIDVVISNYGEIPEGSDVEDFFSKTQSR